MQPNGFSLPLTDAWAFHCPSGFHSNPATLLRGYSLQVHNVSVLAEGGSYSLYRMAVVFPLAGAGAAAAFSAGAGEVCHLCWEVPSAAVCSHGSLFSHSGTWKVIPPCMRPARGRLWLRAPSLACTRISLLTEDNIFPMSHLETSSACLAVTPDCSVTSDPSEYTSCQVLSE